MRQLLLLLLVLALGGQHPVFAAESGEHDLQLRTLTSPSASQHTPTQKVSVTVKNNGEPVDRYYVGVRKNGTLVFEETVSQRLSKGSLKMLTLSREVVMAPGEQADVEVYVRSDETDATPADNSLSVSLSCDDAAPFPYIWNTATITNDFYTVGWTLNAQTYAFGTDRYATIGSVRTAHYLDIPANTQVDLSFSYMATHKGQYTVTVGYADGTTQEFTGPLYNTGGDFVPADLSFMAQGPAYFIITGTSEVTGALDWCTLLFRDISFRRGGTDMSASHFLSPAVANMAPQSSPITVKVAYKNHSVLPCDNPVFGYSFGSQTVEETYAGSVAPGQTVDYVFAQPLAPADLGGLLQAWCRVSGDSKPSNDRISQTLSFTEPQAFPYTTNFTRDNDLWTVIDVNADGHVWNFAPSQGWAYYDSHIGTYGDWLISPPLSLPAGRSRLSFYYATGRPDGQATLRVLLSDSPDLTSPAVLDLPVVNAGWKHGYLTVDLPEAGTRYIAFQANGSTDFISLSKLSVDQADDLCAEAVAFDTTTGWNQTTSFITFTYSNHGVNPRQGTRLKYFVNSFDNVVEETDPQTVQPGQTVSYTFSQPADLSEPDCTYQLIAAVATPVGADLYNDSIMGNSVTHYATQQLPYYTDFTDDYRSSQWHFTSSTGGKTEWLIAYGFDAMEGYKLLVHKSDSYLQPADDWAFSEQVYMPAGNYELSFFYRTFQGHDEPSYAQTFSAHIGTGQDASLMEQTLASFSQVNVSGDYEHHTSEFFVSHDGYYHLGFHNTSASAYGLTDIDCVSIKPLYLVDSLRSVEQELDAHGSSVVYDLQGRRVNPHGRLPKGIYVVRGRKVVRR